MIKVNCLRIWIVKSLTVYNCCLIIATIHKSSKLIKNKLKYRLAEIFMSYYYFGINTKIQKGYSDSTFKAEISMMMVLFLNVSFAPYLIKNEGIIVTVSVAFIIKH